MDRKKSKRQYLETMGFLNESTDDYLFLWDFKTERFHCLGEIYKKYPLEPSEEGYTLEEWISIVYARDVPGLLEMLNKIRSGEEPGSDVECRLVDRDGNRVWVSCRGKSQYDESGSPLWMIGRVSDKIMSNKVDPLTGLLNAAKLGDDMEQCLAGGGKGFLMIAGIDDLKNINIKHGRRMGNHILKKVSAALEEVVDVSLPIYRLYGGRFAVNLIGKDKRTAEEVFDRLKERTSSYCRLAAGAVSYSPDRTADGNILYQYGENALDQAKATGKDTLVFFSPEDFEKYRNRIDLQDELRYSVQNHFSGFSLCYQPQIVNGSFELFGAEALLRYVSRERGAVSPMDFIPILEQTELICPVGEWVLETALLQCREWRRHYPEFHISVNISYVQLLKEGIADRILELLYETGLPGEALTLEVTESMQLQDYLYFNKIFYQWERAGIRIAIDDFGTGYSSLSYLKGIEIDEIKIDRCFVHRIQHSAYNYRLLNNMIELAHTAKIRVCCEGVETEEELQMLCELSPDVLQGYLFAKPCTKEVFEDIYINKDSASYKERIEMEKRFSSQEAVQKKLISNEHVKEELSSIVEGMDEIIYVSDVESHELYYLNSAGRRLTGMYDYKGRKCYKVLQGRDEPCQFCTNGKLKRGEFHVCEKENPFLNRHFILKDKLISWCGKLSRLEIAIDVTEKEVVS